MLIYGRLGDHAAAMRLLATVMADLDGAIGYCRQFAGSDGWLALLEALLRPGGGRPPNYVAACKVRSGDHWHSLQRKRWSILNCACGVTCDLSVGSSPGIGIFWHRC